MKHNIHYQITPKSPEADVFEVSLHIKQPNPDGQVLRLPTWIPGSYTLREFAKHMVQIQAFCDNQPVPIEKLDKSTWRCASCAGILRLRYTVYCFDTSVRAAYLDQTRGFFNGTSVFLSADGFEQQPCSLEILPPQGEAYKSWRLATSLPRLDAELYAFGTYQAADYAELIDHPVEMGHFSVASFAVAGVPHDMVLIGKHRADLARLTQDLEKICNAHVALFGELPVMARYTFLTILTSKEYGGLEHRASCTLMCERNDLPRLGQDSHAAHDNEKGYHRFLGLCSHEYLHLWNVKRIKPAGFLPYDLSRETYTRQLWVFEGITSYYDDLNLVRSGCISPQHYLKLLANIISRVWQTAGRFKQSIAESSFDTWIKLYHPNENTPNAQVSYYSKGALLALALDLQIRRDTDGKKSLDAVMQTAWQRYGKPAIGIPEGGMEKLLETVSGLDLQDFFQRYLYGTEDLPLAELFAEFGINCQFRTATKRRDLTLAQLGIKLDPEAEFEAVIKHTFAGGAAQAAGLSGQDQIIAVEHIKVNKQTIDKVLANYLPGDSISLHAFRRDTLMQFQVTLQAAPANHCELALQTGVDARILKARAAWLHTE